MKKKFYLQFVQNDNFETPTCVPVGFTTFLESLDYYNSKNPGNELLCEKVTIDELDNIPTDKLIEAIPIGTVQFIEKYLKRLNPYAVIKPLNIPAELRINAYINRRIVVGFGEKTVLSFMKENSAKRVMIKSLEKLYAPYEGIYEAGTPFPDTGEDMLFISEEVPCSSIWRVFVHNNEVIDIKQIVGDVVDQADWDIAYDIAKKYRKHKSYVFEIGVSDDENNVTTLLDVHSFVGCATFGAVLPLEMYIDGYEDVLRACKIQ